MAALLSAHRHELMRVRCPEILHIDDGCDPTRLIGVLVGGGVAFAVPECSAGACEERDARDAVFRGRGLGTVGQEFERVPPQLFQDEPAVRDHL